MRGLKIAAIASVSLLVVMVLLVIWHLKRNMVMEVMQVWLYKQIGDLTILKMMVRYIRLLIFKKENIS